MQNHQQVHINVYPTHWFFSLKTYVLELAQFRWDGNEPLLSQVPRFHPLESFRRKNHSCNESLSKAKNHREELESKKLELAQAASARTCCYDWFFT